MWNPEYEIDDGEYNGEYSVDVYVHLFSKKDNIVEFLKNHDKLKLSSYSTKNNPCFELKSVPDVVVFIINKSSIEILSDLLDSDESNEYLDSEEYKKIPRELVDETILDHYINKFDQLPNIYLETKKQKTKRKIEHIGEKEFE